MSASEASTRLLLAETKAEIRYGDKSQEIPCHVYFDLGSSNSLLIEPAESVHAIYSGVDGGSFFLSIPGVRKPIECISILSNLSMGTHGFTVSVKLAPLISIIEVDHNSPLVRVNAGVINLGHYLTGAPGGLNSFSLSHEGWLFDFTPVGERTVLFNPSISDKEYLFTHHLCMSRANGVPFSSFEAHTKLTELSRFLSFCHGHWVGTALVSGLNEHGVVAMEEWGKSLVSRWSNGSNWLDEHHGTNIVELFPKFMGLVARSLEWEATIHRTLYWYIRADTNLVGPDGGIILLQAALERFAWHVLVKEQKSLSEDGFSKLPTADRLRLLLSALSVPLTLPPGLVKLQKAAREFNWVDGPQAFVEIRNLLVHPKSVSRSKHLRYYDAYQLGKWYVELAVLSACGYKGVYSNRTKERRWVGQVEPVPWAIG